MQYKITIFLFSAVILYCGCASTQVFREPKEGQAHATIIFKDADEPSSPWGQLAVFPLKINNKEPNYWKWSHKKFFVEPGFLVIDAQAYIERYRAAFAELEFRALEGRTYYIDRDITEDSVRFYVTDSGGSLIREVYSPKQYYRSQEDSYYIPPPVP